MVAPAVTATTRVWYDSLPEVYRTEDERLEAGPAGFPLLRFLSLIGDQFDEVRTVIARADYYSPDDGGVVGDTSDLADPATADEAWLTWLAQLVGVALAPGLALAAKRSAATGTGGFRAGSKPAIAAAAATVLTGTKAVNVVPLYTGDQWKVEVRVRASEAPAVLNDIIDAVIAAGAKPAGVELVITTVEASWDTIEALRPTWADWEAAGSWTAIEETGL